MARKSRKNREYSQPTSLRVTVGYIRLSIKRKLDNDSVENQRAIIETWGIENQIPICKWFIDVGYSGQSFQRPAFQKMVQAIDQGEIECVVVKDLSRLGRNYIAVGYYLEVYFPKKGVRFVSINDQFDTVDGITDQRQSGMKNRIPLINAFNEQVTIVMKKKMEAALAMKAERGAFIGPRAPFGYQKADGDHDQLVPDPIASITVKKIFDLAANGTSVTGIVRYLNEKGLPTPIQYARYNGLTGDYQDGTGDWNSRSVKYILTNRTYTGMLVQGKEKRIVPGTHAPLVDTEIFDKIQKEFQSRAYNIIPNPTASSDNIFKGKVICACCGGKMQRKRGTNHADWYFFTCIAKNRLGAGKCTGMYAREEDVLNAVYHQLKQYVKQHFISQDRYRQEIKRLDSEIEKATAQFDDESDRFRRQYERFVSGEISAEEFRASRSPKEAVKKEMETLVEKKMDYEKQYRLFCKLLKASAKEIGLCEIIDCIEQIVVNADRKIEVKWMMNG